MKPGNPSLLESLPKYCDADKLEETLAAHLDDINAYCGTDVTAVIANFTREQAIKGTPPGDGIEFSQEGTRVWRDENMSRGYAINPREVVHQLRLALQILKKGQGLDDTPKNFIQAVSQAAAKLLGLYTPPKVPQEQQQAFELSGLGYMTLAWEEKMFLYPAFRWPLGLKISDEDLSTIVAWVKEGRRQIK